MNNETSEKKESILKILAIGGFIGIIILIAWLSIQLVSVAPSAFSSLASLAESVNNRADSVDEDSGVDTLLVTSNTLLANSGDIIDVNWNSAQANGSYVFSYNCADGVAVDLVSETGVQSIQCENNYNIGNVDNISMIIDSEKNRYADVTYDVSFLKTNDTRPRAAGTATLTVLNNAVSSEVAVAEETTEDTTQTEEVVVEETPVVETPTESVTPTTPTNTTPQTEPEYTQEFVYAIPSSDPNGRTDLGTRYLFVGEISNNQFVPRALTQDEDGAIQFEVKNFGTKTSKSWKFEVSLPGGGTFESDSQLPLKPNERAVLTIGFNASDVNSHSFKVEVQESTDTNSANDSFSQRVTFSN
jgi:hypothetical protein